MWTNSDFKVWLEEINYSSLSQEALKQAASKFYYKFGDLNKKTVLRCVEDFVKTDKNELTKVSHILFKEQGGTEGKMKGRFDIPPQNYCPKDFKAFEMRPWCQGAMMRCDSCDSEMSSTEEISEHIHSAHKETLKEFLPMRYYGWLQIINCIVNGCARPITWTLVGDLLAQRKFISLRIALRTNPKTKLP